MIGWLAFTAMATQWPEREWAFKPVEAGVTSGIREARVVLIRDQQQLVEYMAERGSPRRPLPKIDWKINQVVAVHVGSRPTAGYTVDVKHLWKHGKDAEVEIEVKGPPADAVVAQVITYPFAMVRTERFPGHAFLKQG